MTMIEYYDKYIESKKEYINSNQNYHPLYLIGNVKGVSNKFIKNILNDNSIKECHKLLF